MIRYQIYARVDTVVGARLSSRPTFAATYTYICTYTYMYIYIYIYLTIYR